MGTWLLGGHFKDMGSGRLLRASQTPPCEAQLQHRDRQRGMSCAPLEQCKSEFWDPFDLHLEVVLKKLEKHCPIFYLLVFPNSFH